ncbi:MAG: hypothetical protein HZA24_12070 [Nitrospirae bacterium]|nr:hypothetical protein [Nitrospirota bacterium]
MHAITRTCLFFTALLLNACVYSIIDIANTDIPENTLPRDFLPRMKANYGVGDVIVVPRFAFPSGNQTEYKLHIAFYSENPSADTSIKSVALKINGQDFAYGKKMIGAPASEWWTNPTLAPYFVCGISGEPISKPFPEMIKASVDLALTVVIRNADGTVTEKEITAHFEPRKRSYFFSV